MTARTFSLKKVVTNSKFLLPPIIPRLQVQTSPRKGFLLGSSFLPLGYTAMVELFELLFQFFKLSGRKRGKKKTKNKEVDQYFPNTDLRLAHNLKCSK